MGPGSVNAAVLVDTSVWIDHLRDRPSAAAAQLAAWLSEDADRILVNEVVIAELLRGLRSDHDAAQLQAALEQLAQAGPIVRSDWLESARIYRACRLAGLTIRSPMDCLIASHAIRLQVPVLAIDRDFEAIASCTPLALHRPAA
jgi:predicted nucleic acid-binding protein